MEIAGAYVFAGAFTGFFVGLTSVGDTRRCRDLGDKGRSTRRRFQMTSANPLRVFWNHVNPSQATIPVTSR